MPTLKGMVNKIALQSLPDVSKDSFPLMSLGKPSHNMIVIHVMPEEPFSEGSIRKWETEDS